MHIAGREGRLGGLFPHITASVLMIDRTQEAELRDEHARTVFRLQAHTRAGIEADGDLEEGYTELCLSRRCRRWSWFWFWFGRHRTARSCPAHPAQTQDRCTVCVARSQPRLSTQASGPPNAPASPDSGQHHYPQRSPHPPSADSSLLQRPDSARPGGCASPNAAG